MRIDVLGKVETLLRKRSDSQGMERGKTANGRKAEGGEAPRTESAFTP